MKALVYDHYGPPDGLRIDDIAVPTPGQGQVLVRVVACSINLSDWECLLGSPLYARLGGPLKPSTPVLGSDIAGIVEEVGPGVTTFGPGDAVYGDHLFTKGGLAEYTVLPSEAIAAKPDGLTFAEASTIPQAGPIATQGTANVGPGDRVLINGAGGGSGAFALQLAKLAGAEVTAVDNASKLDHLRSLGADRVIDYRTTDFTRTGERYDTILDLVATRSPFAYRRALAPGGRYGLVGGSMAALLGVLTTGFVLGRRSGRRLRVLAIQSGPQHFTTLADRCVAGDVAIVIDRRFGLDEARDALRHVGEGRSLGKVVVQVIDEP